jgi:hypothetical protein
MTVALSQSVTFAIGNEDADGAPVNASSIVGTLYRNGAATAEDVDVDNVATGVYSVAFTVPADWSIADVLQVRIVADGIGRFVWGDAIDATVNSRSTYAGADTSGTTTLLTRIVGTLASGTHNPQSGDAFARLGAPAGASVSADIAAISTVTARINTGLVADGGVWQFTANMLELGPSGGGGGGGLTPEQEETLNSIPSLITGTEVIQVASPNLQGNLVLTQGDDYDGVANPRASWTVGTDYTSGWTVRLTIRDTDDNVVYTTTGSVVSASVVAVTIAAPTGLTMTGCPGQWQGKFDVELTHSSGKKKTIALGVCYINEDQTRV